MTVKNCPASKKRGLNYRIKWRILRWLTARWADQGAGMLGFGGMILRDYDQVTTVARALDIEGSTGRRN